MARKPLVGWALGAAAVLLTAGAALGLSTRHLRLNLGPGDSPFVSGFEPDSDVVDKVGWHWTTYDATIDLPFEIRGAADADVTLRYARVFGEEAVIEATVAGIRTEAFRARGGEVRTTTLWAAGASGPVTIAIKSDSHERRNMGLRMDRLGLDVVSGAPLKLRWGAALRPVWGAALLFLGLVILGSSPLVAGGLTMAAAVGFAVLASIDLFGAWRQVSLAPGMLILATPVLLAARQWLVTRMTVDKDAATGLAAAALVTLVIRLALIFHPDFYYPDLLTHTRVVEAIRNEGPSFFLHPGEALGAQGAWTKPVLGSVSALPYAVMFHTPFAVLASVFDLSTDEIETTLKAASSLISILPVLFAGALAVRFSLPPRAALLLCVIPAYTSRLSFALLPALLGHVFDLIVLLTLSIVLTEDDMKSRRSSFATIAALLLGHLAYTSSVVNEAIFVGVLAGLFLVTAGPGRAVSLRLVFAEVVAALLAFGLYYRHFVGDGFGLMTRVLGLSPGGGASPSSVYPIESFWALLFERTSSFFGWPYAGLALLGLGFGGRLIARSNLVRAWGITYLTLILLRAKIPDVFRYGHETLFITPLVALLGGFALIAAFRKGGAWRAVSVIAGVVLCVVSCWQQWVAVSDQLANAR